LDAVKQYFRTGEIWAINAQVLRGGMFDGRKYLTTGPFEDILVVGLRDAFRFHRDVTHIEPPLVVELGIVGIGDREIAHQGYAIGRQPKFASDTITHEAIMNNNTHDQAIAAVALEFFEKINRDTGVPRPKGLYGR
jgi:hypothetical protein